MWIRVCAPARTQFYVGRESSNLKRAVMFSGFDFGVDPNVDSSVDPNVDSICICVVICFRLHCLLVTTKLVVDPKFGPGVGSNEFVRRARDLQHVFDLLLGGHLFGATSWLQI